MTTTNTTNKATKAANPITKLKSAATRAHNSAVKVEAALWAADDLFKSQPTEANDIALQAAVKAADAANGKANETSTLLQIALLAAKPAEQTTAEQIANDTASAAKDAADIAAAALKAAQIAAKEAAALVAQHAAKAAAEQAEIDKAAREKQATIEAGIKAQKAAADEAMTNQAATGWLINESDLETLPTDNRFIIGLDSVRNYIKSGVKFNAIFKSLFKTSEGITTACQIMDQCLFDERLNRATLNGFSTYNENINSLEAKKSSLKAGTSRAKISKELINLKGLKAGGTAQVKFYDPIYRLAKGTTENVDGEVVRTGAACATAPNGYKITLTDKGFIFAAADEKKAAPIKALLPEVDPEQGGENETGGNGGENETGGIDGIIASSPLENMTALLNNQNVNLAELAANMAYSEDAGITNFISLIYQAVEGKKQAKLDKQDISLLKAGKALEVVANAANLT